MNNQILVQGRLGGVALDERTGGWGAVILGRGGRSGFVPLDGPAACDALVVSIGLNNPVRITIEADGETRLKRPQRPAEPAASTRPECPACGNSIFDPALDHHRTCSIQSWQSEADNRQAIGQLDREVDVAKDLLRALGGDWADDPLSGTPDDVIAIAKKSAQQVRLIGECIRRGIVFGPRTVVDVICEKLDAGEGMRKAAIAAHNGLDLLSARLRSGEDVGSEEIQRVLTEHTDALDAAVNPPAPTPSWADDDPIPF